MDTRLRKIAITGILGGISILLGATRWGFIPWFAGAALTIMHVPVIIGAVLEGPLVGVGIGLIFGLFSLLQAAIAPTGPVDVWFTNPLLSVLPRLFIGPVAWLVYRALMRSGCSVIAMGAMTTGLLVTGSLAYLLYAVLNGMNWVLALIVALLVIALFVASQWWLVSRGRGKEVFALATAGVAGSLTNTFLVLGMIAVLGHLPWAALPPIVLFNGIPEAIAAAWITVAVVAAWKQIALGRQGSSV